MMQFEFLEKNIFFGAQTVKMTIFKFKLKTLTNQKMSHRYRSGGTNHHSSSGDGTNQPGRSIPLYAAWAARSTVLGGTDLVVVGTDH
jgi:hypothetical protein